MATVEVRVGFRFHPTEEELVNYYLNNKIQGHDFNDFIPEIDICSYEPWDLPGFSLIKSDQEWFYFSKPKFRNNRSQVNRATKRGFWKITGREREIKARESKAVIGKKRTLTFYKGKVRRGQKTNWVIHEYYIPETLLPKMDFVLCRLKKKDESTEIGACDEGEPRANDPSDFEILPALVHRAGVPEENTRPEEILGSLCSSWASPASPQLDVYLSSMLRGANAGSTNHIETEDDTEFLNSIFIDQDDYSFEEGTHTTLNHSNVGEKLLEAAQDITLPVASGLSEGDKDDMLLNQLFGKDDASVNVAVNKPWDIDCVQSVTDEIEHEPSPILLQEPQAFGDGPRTNCMMLVTDESSINKGRRRQTSIIRQTAQSSFSWPKGRTETAQSSFSWPKGRTETAQSFGYKEVLVTDEKHYVEGEDVVAAGWEKHYVEGEDVVAAGGAFSLPVASSFSERDKDVVLLDQLSGKNAFSVNTAASRPRNIHRAQHMGPRILPASFQSVSEETKYQPCPSFPVEPQGSNLPLRTLATDESSLYESSHFDFSPEFATFQATGSMFPTHMTARGGYAETHSGSKGSFIVWKTSPIIHRSYPPIVYFFNLISGLFWLHTLAGEFVSNGREIMSLKPLLIFLKEVVIPVSVAISCRERNHGFLFSLFFYFCSYFLARQICF